MTWTYDLSTDVGKCRLELGDSTEGRGVRPNSVNFSDEEIELFLSEEGTAGRAAARCAEILARAWASEPTNWRLGPESEQQKAVEYWQSEAKRLRDAYGHADSSVTAEGLFDWYDSTE